jgi:hypothetical protein
MASPAKPKSAKPGAPKAPAAAAALAPLVRVSMCVCAAGDADYGDMHTTAAHLQAVSPSSPQLPADMPSECPFVLDWQPLVCSVQAGEGISLPALKEAFRQLRVLQALSLSELAARVDADDPLQAELAAAAAAAEEQQQAAAGGAGGCVWQGPDGPSRAVCAASCHLVLSCCACLHTSAPFTAWQHAWPQSCCGSILTRSRSSRGDLSSCDAGMRWPARRQTRKPHSAPQRQLQWRTRTPPRRLLL